MLSQSSDDLLLQRLRALLGQPPLSPGELASLSAPAVPRDAHEHVDTVTNESAEPEHHDGATEDEQAPPAPPPPPPTPMEQLIARIARAGLALRPFDAPVAVALSGVRAGRPVVTVRADGSILILSERLGRLVRVEDEAGRREWLDEAKLVARLGLVSAGSEHAWLAVDAPDAFSLALHGDQSPWRAAYDLVRADRADLLAIAVYAAGVGLLSLVLPLTVQVLVNTVAFGTLLQPIAVLTLLLGAGLVFAAVLQAMQAFLVEVIQRRVFVRVVTQLAARLPRLHVSALERRHGPELLNRFFDVFLAQKALASLALGGIEAALAALVGLVLLAVYHPLLLGFGALIVVGVALVLRVLGRGATTTAIDESKAKYAIAAWLQEMAGQRVTLKLAGGAEFAALRLDGLAASWLQARDTHFRILFRQYVGTLGLQVLTSASLLGMGGWLVVQRELTIGQLVAAELVVGAIVASLNKLGGKLESAYDLVAAADKVEMLFDLPLEREGGADVTNGRGPARVELQGVTTAGHELVGLDLTLEAGQRLAVQGDARHTDALVELLFGLRAQAAGAALLDGDDLRDLSLRALRGRVAVVSGPEVLPTTIGENVAAVGRVVSPREIWQALARVGLEPVVRALPEGLETVLTPTGAPLSRADALRLTLARALVLRPGLLVLDRVLDALPPAASVGLLGALGRDSTLLLVTHTAEVQARVDAQLTLSEARS